MMNDTAPQHFFIDPTTQSSMHAKHWIYKHAISPALDFYTTRSLDREGWYRIEPQAADIAPFDLYLPGKGRFQRKRIQGELEPDVMAALNEVVREDDLVFDVGAGWGYFSLAAARMGADVYAFELLEDRIETISQASERNGLDIETVVGAVGDDVSLNDYPVPDVIKMDIEGWEFAALLSAPDTVEAHPTWIIELHDFNTDINGAPTRSPEGVIEYLESKGYHFEYLEKRSQDNYHIIAK